jgi:hypothetical protein
MTTSPSLSYSFRRGGQLLFQTPPPYLDVSTPERRLAFAVLSDAVRHVREGGARAAEEEAWFTSDATDHPFAFVAICHVLGLDPDHLRRSVRRLHRRLPHAHAA